jgi:hypothetical protein
MQVASCANNFHNLDFQRNHAYSKNSGEDTHRQINKIFSKRPQEEVIFETIVFTVIHIIKCNDPC